MFETFQLNNLNHNLNRSRQVFVYCSQLSVEIVKNINKIFIFVKNVTKSVQCSALIIGIRNFLTSLILPNS